MRRAASLMLAVIGLSCGHTAAPLLCDGERGWPHEPAGLSALTDQPWNDLVSDGWKRRESSNDRIISDASAPLSAPDVLEYVYPAGFAGGTAPATHYYPLNGRKEIFVGLELKVSDPWQGHSSGVNKIQFIYTAGSDVAMVMFGPRNGPYGLRVLPQWHEHGGSWLTGNVSDPRVTLGQWHRLEWYLKYETTYGAGDGIVRWWMDGTLVGDYAKVRYPNDAGFSEYQLSPTWGGVGDIKARSDYYRFDQSYISCRSEAVSGQSARKPGSRRARSTQRDRPATRTEAPGP